MHTLNKNGQVVKEVTPQLALTLLKEGNYRFVNNLKVNRDLLKMVNETKDGQKPFAAIVSCMDSRTSAELIFDQGLGDIFSIRIAGNIITEDILGSLEFAVAVTGVKLVVVLGHSSCGAIKGACDNVQLGNLTSLLAKIQPAVAMEQTIKEDRNSSNATFVEAVAHLNVRHSVQQIMEHSPVLREIIERGDAGLVPAMYDVATGIVNFIDEDAVMVQAVAEVAADAVS